MRRVLSCLSLATGCFVAHGVGTGLAATTNSISAPIFPSDVRVEQNVAFLGEARDEKADLYFPLQRPENKGFPAVVIIHGGGWNTGRKDKPREINIGSTLARHGYVGLSIDYKLSYERDVVWPQNLHDCKNAVRWLRKNAERLRIDPERIGVIGGSAGGHLAAMVALTGPGDGLEPAEPYGGISDSVRCCVFLYGISEVAAFQEPKMLGKTFKEAPELYRQASPLTYVRSNSPPFLILHGTADETVAPRQSQQLSEALKKAGVEQELVLIEGAPHSFHLQPKQRDLRPLVLDFFDRQLKRP